MNDIKKKIRSWIPERFKKFVAYSDEIEYGSLSFSQFAEDLILKNFFSGTSCGFYVDIGAHHPIRYSNTYIFYKQGWRGLNIEPLPGISALFKKIRPHDITIEIGVSDVASELNYYTFREPLENTFIKERAEQINSPLNSLKEIVKIKVMRLEELLDTHLPKDKSIDLLSIDAEGFDLNILKSNNWEKYRPQIVLVEDFEFTFSNYGKSSIQAFMKGIGYSIEAVVGKSVFFKRDLLV